MYAIFAHGYRVEGRQNVPATGPVLLIGNHQSYFDIPMMGLASPRRTFFLAKKSLFRHRLLRWPMEFFGTVAVDNEGFSRAGLAGILQELQKQNAVMLYPEGERSWDGKLAPLKPGVSLLVRRAKCPIVPVGIAGAFDAWPRTKTLPRFAPPFLARPTTRIAVSVGPAIDGAALAHCERETIVQVLSDALAAAIARAKRLQRGTADATTRHPGDVAACESPCTSRR